MTSTEYIQEVAIKQLATALKDSSFAQYEGEPYPDFRVDGAIPAQSSVVIVVTSFNSYGSVSDNEEAFRIKVEVERL